MSAREVQRVLVVEDDASLRRTLERTLAERFPEVRTSATRAEAEAALAGWTPDLLLLDVQLPDGDAFDVLREVAARGVAPPIVAMSGSASREHALALQRLGVRAYLQKPLTSAALTRALGLALGTDAATGDADEPGARPARDGRLRRFFRSLRRRD
jgi:DNA-binding response OmpR family regulator